MKKSKKQARIFLLVVAAIFISLIVISLSRSSESTNKKTSHHSIDSYQDLIEAIDHYKESNSGSLCYDEYPNDSVEIWEFFADESGGFIKIMESNQVPVSVLYQKDSVTHLVSILNDFGMFCGEENGKYYEFYLGTDSGGYAIYGKKDDPEIGKIAMLLCVAEKMKTWEKILYAD